MPSVFRAEMSQKEDLCQGAIADFGYSGRADSTNLGRRVDMYMVRGIQMTSQPCCTHMTVRSRTLVRFQKSVNNILPPGQQSSRCYCEMPSCCRCDGPPGRVRNVVIIGGGWAGLAAAYHLLDREDAPRVVIIDEKVPGEGGASAAAAGMGMGVRTQQDTPGPDILSPTQVSCIPSRLAPS